MRLFLLAYPHPVGTADGVELDVGVPSFELVFAGTSECEVEPEGSVIAELMSGGPGNV
jgi:hypothetical protein